MTGASPPDRSAARQSMVRHDLRTRGVTDERVLGALASVPRERFVPDHLVELAYEDSPLPIEAGQTISQPLIVALMAQAAEVSPTDRVLEVGAGSGYGAAVLGQLAAEVWSVERHDALVRAARVHLAAVGAGNVHVVEGDGSLGWPAAAPFDAVVVTAGAPAVPDPLIEQLADGGRLVIPVGPAIHEQRLLRLRKRGTVVEREDLGPVSFVPLVGTAGWSTPQGSDAAPHTSR